MLLVDVRDNYFVRTKAAKPGEDHLELTLAGQPLHHLPRRRRAPSRRWRAGAARRPRASRRSRRCSRRLGRRAGDPDRRRSPATRSGMPPLPTRSPSPTATPRPASRPSAPSTRRAASSSPRATRALEGFLKDRSLKRSDIWFDKGISLGGKSGGRVVIGRARPGLHHRRLRLHRAARSRRAPTSRTRASSTSPATGARRWSCATSSAAPAARATCSPSGASSATRDPARLRRRGRQVARRGPRRRQGRLRQARARHRHRHRRRRAPPASPPTSCKESPAEDMIPVLLPWGDDRQRALPVPRRRIPPAVTKTGACATGMSRIPGPKPDRTRVLSWQAGCLY